MEPKRAIIIGATSGIGRAVALLLARRGWQVGIAGRRQELLTEMQRKELNIVATQRIDVTQAGATTALETLIGKLGGMDLYLHSSGVGFQNPLLEPEKEIATAETNVVGVTRLAGAAFTYFAARPERTAHLAVISSIAGTKGLGAAPAYSASKRYVNHYLECLTQLCAIRRIKHLHIHDIRPGFVRTPLLGDGGSYPMQLEVEQVAREIVRGIAKNKAILTIDWKYRLLVGLWRLIPRWLWVRLRIVSKKV